MDYSMHDTAINRSSVGSLENVSMSTTPVRRLTVRRNSAEDDTSNPYFQDTDGQNLHNRSTYNNSSIDVAKSVDYKYKSRKSKLISQNVQDLHDIDIVNISVATVSQEGGDDRPIEPPKKDPKVKSLQD